MTVLSPYRFDTIRREVHEYLNDCGVTYSPYDADVLVSAIAALGNSLVSAVDEDTLNDILITALEDR